MDTFDRRQAALKANANAADDLAVMLCELEGGDALVECTELRNEIFHWVYRRNRPARDKILNG